VRRALAPLAAVLLLGACGGFASAGEAQADTPATAANAAAAPARHFPTLAGRVVDEAGLLTADQARALADRAAALEQRTGDQLVIVTIGSLEGRTIEAYAREIGNRWGIGAVDKDNGVVLLVAPAERRTRISTGRGLAQVLTDAEARTIVDRDLVPHFRGGDWYGGLAAGVGAIADLLAARADVPRGRRQ
jgi:uncharacterized protein